MGSASATVAGEQQEAPLHLPSLPMENSPPGIHAMPSGAFVGAGVLLGMVGAKADAARLAGTAAFVTGCASAVCRASADSNAMAIAARVARVVAVDFLPVLEPGFDFIWMTGREAGFDQGFTSLRLRTGTFLARGVISTSAGEGSDSAPESQMTAFSKSLKVCTLQPRNLAMDANMLARRCGSER